MTSGAGGVLALYIVNRNGSLIYDMDFTGGATALSSNDKIRLSSTFHGISAIASQISPVSNSASQNSFSFMQPSGIVAMDANNFRLQCFHTATGIKLFVVAQKPVLKDYEEILRQTYGLY